MFKSLGLALAAVIANTVTKNAAGGGEYKSEGDAIDYTPEELMQGYVSAWWLCVGFSAVTIPVGKVGEKKDLVTTFAQHMDTYRYRGHFHILTPNRCTRAG